MYPITLTKKLQDVAICGIRLGDLDCPAFTYPWKMMQWFHKNINQILQSKVHGTNTGLKSYNNNPLVYIGQNVSIAKNVVFDAVDGLIIIDDNSTVEAFSCIQGPCYIGKNVVIQPYTQIRKNTSIGDFCKIGGEVSGSIFQPYTNKAHYGFVGDSYVGSWVNLGAGTSTSNLKNTYGPVRVEYQGQKIDTEMQFFGCVIGDYVKSAINTSIFTGKIIGVCAQLFGFVTKNVPSFVMDMHGGQEQKEFSLEAGIRMQKRMFKRRGVKQTQDDIKMMKQIFENTKKYR